MLQTFMFCPDVSFFFFFISLSSHLTALFPPSIEKEKKKKINLKHIDLKECISIEKACKAFDK